MSAAMPRWFGFSPLLTEDLDGSGTLGGISVVRQDWILFRSRPSSSAGTVEASTRAASSETVRKARMVLSDTALCGRFRFALVLAATVGLPIQAGAA